MTSYVQTPIATSVHLLGENPVFGESVIEVALDDDAAGPFVVLRHSETASEIRMDYEQLVAITEAARTLVEGARERCE